MRDLILQERFELEVLDRLNSARVLPQLVFTGGTMLRLCHGLNRYSVDLDFWLATAFDAEDLFRRVNECLSQPYVMKDAADKFHSLVFQAASTRYPRSLKVEIRKQAREVATERTIAFSPHAATQVLVNAVSLPDMMRAKLAALTDRREARDAFDLEFLLRKGIALQAPTPTLREALGALASLTENDYKVKLGSLLQQPYREYYAAENFKLPQRAIQNALTVGLEGTTP